MQQAENIERKSKLRSFLVIGATAAMGWLLMYLGAHHFKDYGFGLFVGLPIFMGAVSTLLHGYRHETTRPKLLGITFLTLCVFFLGLLVFAWEGLICLFMAFPIGLALAFLGNWIGRVILEQFQGKIPAVVLLLFVSLPALMAFEHAAGDADDLRSVTTSIEIDASPEEVWKNVVAFPRLPAPEEFVFTTGIAYPVNATIEGAGVGAVRHCNFSTGSFVEPITVWDAPRLLKFSVAEQPETMKEISFYDIHPNHLHGYWVSKQGQFKLTRLPNSHTLLEGTTWYVNRIKPGFYWTLWSDYIVHKIHKRVLQHIKTQTEK